MDRGEPSVGTGLPPALERVGMEAFVERIRHAHGDPQRLEAVLNTVAPTWNSTADWVRSRKNAYTRSLVYRDDEVEVLVLTWATNARTPIHDHSGQQSWIRVIRGELEVSNYRQVRGRRSLGYAYVEPLGQTHLIGEGEFESLAPLALHQVRTSPTAPFAVSIHVYAKPIERLLVYDVRHGRSEERRLRYDFIGPRTRQEPSPHGIHLPAPEPHGLHGFLARLVRRAKEAGEDLLVPAHVENARAQVQMRGVQHRYGEFEALRDVSINVRSGDFLCLLGPSGCGKSTLLYALAGHVKPTGGALCIDGRRIVKPGPDRLLMFQDAALFPWLTVEQNITFVLGARGIARKQRKPAAREFIRRVQLDGFEAALPHQLSGGMKMRASLARALAVDPPVLLMDEPFGSLDAQTRLSMQQLLHSVWQERKKTIVFVTHDVHEALLLGTRVVVMAARPGRVMLDAEVRLPSPRDPDDQNLGVLARRLREYMRGTPPPAAEVRDVR